MYYLRSLKFILKHLKRSYAFRSQDHPHGAYIVLCSVSLTLTRPSSGSIYCAVQRESHAAQHKTHNHNQAHSKQLTTHTQNHDKLPLHQS